jgi:hypothetical protein
VQGAQFKAIKAVSALDLAGRAAMWQAWLGRRQFLATCAYVNNNIYYISMLPIDKSSMVFYNSDAMSIMTYF